MRRWRGPPGHKCRSRELGIHTHTASDSPCEQIEASAEAQGRRANTSRVTTMRTDRHRDCALNRGSQRHSRYVAASRESNGESVRCTRHAFAPAHRDRVQWPRSEGHIDPATRERARHNPKHGLPTPSLWGTGTTTDEPSEPSNRAPPPAGGRTDHAPLNVSRNVNVDGSLRARRF